MDYVPLLAAALSGLLFAAQLFQVLSRWTSWNKVEARVIDKWVNLVYRHGAAGLGTPVYITWYEFEYRFQGCIYRSEVAGFRSHPTEQHARNELKRHRYGSGMAIRVNPLRPYEIEIFRPIFSSRSIREVLRLGRQNSGRLGQESQQE